MDPNRLLHKDSSHGYTNRLDMAMPAEPEAVSESVQADFSARSRSFFEVARADELAKQQTRSRCNRLRELEIEARHKAIDPTRPLAEIERGMSMLEQMVRGTVAAA